MNKLRELNREDMQLTLFYYSTLTMLFNVEEEDIINIMMKDKPTAEEALHVCLWVTHVHPIDFDVSKMVDTIMNDESQEYALNYMLFGAEKYNMKAYNRIKDIETLAALRAYSGLTQRVLAAYKSNATPEVIHLSNMNRVDETEALKCLSTLSISEMAEEDVIKKTVLRYEMGNVTSMYLRAKALNSSLEESGVNSSS